jgi:hypothetical protein
MDERVRIIRNFEIEARNFAFGSRKQVGDVIDLSIVLRRGIVGRFVHIVRLTQQHLPDLSLNSVPVEHPVGSPRIDPRDNDEVMLNPRPKGKRLTLFRQVIKVRDNQNIVSLDFSDRIGNRLFDCAFLRISGLTLGDDDGRRVVFDC